MILPELASRSILADPRISTVIPGTREVVHVEANYAVRAGQQLDPDPVEHLRWESAPKG